MKKLSTAALFLMLTGTAFAQEGRVGINTETPKTTFDVNGKKDGSGNLLTTDVTGMQAPRLTRAELTAKGDVLYGADQKGALVYITDVTAGDALTQRINITAAGYYYFDGTVWQKMGGSGAAAGDPTTDAWVNDATNTMVKLGTLSDGTTARPAGTEFVALDNGNVGIGTMTPPHKFVVETNNPANFSVSSRLNNTSSTGWSNLEFSENGAQNAWIGFAGSNNFYANIRNRLMIMGWSDGVNIMGSNDVRFYTQGWSHTGYERMRITHTAVGINTLNPTNRLHVVATNPLRLEGLVAATTPATDELLLTDATGVVKKGGTLASALTGAGLDATNDAWVNDATNTMVKLGTLSDGTTARPAGTEFVALDNGKVGIGTNAPGAKLDVIGGYLRLGTSLTDATVKGANILYPHYTSSEENIRMISGYTSGTESVVVIGGGDTAFNTATKISFFTAANNTTLNGVERMRINGVGNVGIGTTTPTNKLDVAATTNPLRLQGLVAATTPATDELLLTDATGVVKKGGTLASALTGAGLDATNDAWVNDATNTMVKLGTLSDGTTARPAAADFVALDNGSVGIGTITPTSKLQVVGLPIHVDNTAALAAGLTVGAFYHAGDGIVRVVF